MVTKIARFAFPEYEDHCNATDFSQWQQTKQKMGWNESNSGNLNRHDGYLEEVYSMTGNSLGSQNSSSGGNSGSAQSSSSPLPLPSYHVFSHRLANGSTVHGHVRRYLPYHVQAAGSPRRDVGRRSARALVLLTRNSGGGNRLYLGILKSLEMLILQQQQGNSNDSGSGNDEDLMMNVSGKQDMKNASGSELQHRLRWFMHSIHQEHVNLCRSVASAMEQNNNTQTPSKKQLVLAKPRILTLPLVELGRGHGLFGSIDVVKLAVPSSFLHGHISGSSSDSIGSDQTGLSRNDMMPMLRCLGVPRTLRLLSALMSERRVIFTCGNAAKLSSVSYGAVAMMGQGLLSPPSVFVPVLPPGLASLLQTPSAYLIGVLTGSTPNYINLRNVPNIGEVVLFDLDNQQGNEPFFHGIADPQRAVPDLTRRNVDDLDVAASRFVTVADILYQDLTEVIKMDKKIFYQGAVQEKLGMAAAKGKKVASAAVKKGLKYFKSKSSSKAGNNSFDEKEGSERSAGGGDGEDDDVAEQQQSDSSAILSKLVGKGNYAYEHGFSNEETEVEARIAFGGFFVSLLGDIRTYVTQQTPGMPPVPDKQKFMKFRVANGDIPGSGMFFLIGNFLRGKMFDSFAEARLVEVQMRRVVPEDAPLFALVANHHRVNKIDFVVNSIRHSVRQIATNPDLPGNYLIKWNKSILARSSELTASQTYSGDFRSAVMQLTDDCRESSTILIDTMMVLWTRIQEGRGMQWKKALLALQIFRHLLLNGPINAIAEAIDGFASIRILKSYTEALRGQNSKLVRDVALEIYSLVVNLPVLFARRRELLNQRRLAKDPKPSPLRKETQMISGINQFRNIHIAFRPAGATVAPAPTPVNDLLFQQAPSAAPTGVANPMNVPANGPPSENYSNDLLSLSVAVSPSPRVVASNGTLSASVPQPGNYSNDLLALSFGASPSPQVAAANNVGSGEQKKPDPFNMQAMSQATPNAGPPTANIPLSQPMHQQPTSQPTLATASFAMASNTPALMSQPAPQQVQKQFQPQTMTNGPTMTQPKHAIGINAPTSRPVQHIQQHQSQTIINQPPVTMQPKQAQLQPTPMLNTSFSMATNTPVPPSQPMQQMQQSQTNMKVPIMNQSPMSLHPAQGGNFPVNYHQPPHQQQQTWSNAAAAFAQNEFQSNHQMPPQNASYGLGHSAAQGHSSGAPPAGYQMTQGAPQFQQGASQVPGMPHNAYVNAQKK